MAQDIVVSWVPPTQDTANKPTTVTKVRIYEIQPGNPNPVLAMEIADSATLTAKQATLVGYYTTARPYTFVVSSCNADGESSVSPQGTDSVDVPQAMGAPGVKIVPKP